MFVCTSSELFLIHWLRKQSLMLKCLHIVDSTSWFTRYESAYSIRIVHLHSLILVAIVMEYFLRFQWFFCLYFKNQYPCTRRVSTTQLVSYSITLIWSICTFLTDFTNTSTQNTKTYTVQYSVTPHLSPELHWRLNCAVLYFDNVFILDLF